MGKFYSDTLEKGIRLLYFQADPQKFPEGVRYVEQAVQAGEPDAYYYLARCYAWEDGNVKEDIHKAKNLSKKGIELGSDLAVLGADRMDQLKGDVKAAMRRPLRESFDAVLRAAQAGDPMSQYAIGLFYFWGDMMIHFQHPESQEQYARYEKENAAESLKWFRLSAEQGCIPAFRNAFNSVRNGLNGVKKDPNEAVHWAEMVKDKVDMRDYYLSMIREYQGLRDYHNANRWCKIGLEAGDTSCAVELGIAYLNGQQGLPVNEKEALRLFEVAAQHGNEYGYYNVGRCYYNGWGCTINYDVAFTNFEQARRLNQPIAELYLSRCYYWGRGVAENQDLAFQMAKSMKDKKKSYPAEILGMCYLYGKGTPVDYIKAKEYLEEAAPDYATACRSLGDMYDRGLGVMEDAAMAASYYEKAANKGNEEAKKDLKRFKKTLFGKWKRR